MLNHVSAGCFTRMTGYGGRLWRTQHLARLGRKSLSFSKSVELHDKVIGHYLNIKHYQ
ncbi:IS1 family transposase [Escherichia coli]|uniref:IS1 family transposase n=1 Tax=Escherichia coli TaxID=562 RepID=UPI0032E92CDF